MTDPTKTIEAATERLWTVRRKLLKAQRDADPANIPDMIRVYDLAEERCLLESIVAAKPTDSRAWSEQAHKERAARQNAIEKLWTVELEELKRYATQQGSLAAELKAEIEAEQAVH